MARVDIPPHILTTLVCSKCEQVLKRGPVFQQHDGAAVCGLCQTRKEAQPASRCLLYEKTAELLAFPCRYRKEGCPDTVPFMPPNSKEENHEDACEFRQYVCPLLGSNRCDWVGRRNQLLQHCEDQHPEHVLANPAEITPDIHHSKITDYVISAFHFLFILHTRVSVSTAKLYYAVRLFDKPQLASNYSYTIKVQRGGNVLAQSRDVLQQELLVLPEHSALELCVRSLLSVLGGWDGASLSVEVKVRAPRPQDELCECGVSTSRQYRNEQGLWLCAGCAPKIKTCSNEGCDFQDISWWKREKHSMWFCEWRTSCGVCGAVLRDTQLKEHYLTCDKITVVRAGTRFCVQRANWQRFYVETGVDPVMCGVKYTYKDFQIFVRAPVTCAQLHLHRCEVRLECAGNTRTHTLDATYKTNWDWDLKFQKDKFFDNRDVYISLQLSKIE